MSHDPIHRVGNAAVNAIADRVGDLVTTLWDYSLGSVVNLLLLSRNAEELAQEVDKLQRLMEDLKNQAERDARRNQADVTHQLSGWMDRVATLAANASKVQRSFEGRSFCVTGFCLGYNAVELLRRARRLTEEGNALSGGQLSNQRGPDAIQPVLSEISSSTLVGEEESLQRIKGYIEDEDIGIIGIWGMGGAGKTSLLKVINNEFLTGEACRDKFEVSI
ncbi:hypothetical protein Taro_037466 [Colocasia esculenta]|uniref:NB-ARC domain-containing protein n=1 Tax=Colocasia esculenta TaxID=4460 RepID=A0A843W0L8_COLES|nr:hypothetical protein [Colocasia esculenta]